MAERFFKVFSVLSLLAHLIFLATSIGAQTLDEEWDGYFRERHGKIGIVIYQPNFQDRPQNTASRALVLSLALKSQREDFLPDPAEELRLQQIDASFDEIERATKAQSLGRETTDGRRTFVYVTQTPDDLGQRLSDAAILHGYERPKFETMSVAAAFEDILLPTLEEWQGYRDEVVLNQLAEAGDKAEKVRRIDHWAYFPDQVSAQAFSEAVAAEGFVLVGLSPTKERTTEYVVTSYHMGTALPESLKKMTLFQAQHAARHGGTYDG